jgi:hypothetical protein
MPIYHEKMQQNLLDTFAQLPELRTLLVYPSSSSEVRAGSGELVNFEPVQGLRYVDNLEIEEWEIYRTAYALVKDGERTVGYREIR